MYLQSTVVECNSGKNKINFTVESGIKWDSLSCNLQYSHVLRLAILKG
jgi:hypothetical protein